MFSNMSVMEKSTVKCYMFTHTRKSVRTWNWTCSFDGHKSYPNAINV